MDALFEPIRKVHNMWRSDDKAEDWVPQRQYQYLGGSQGGTEASPSARMIDMASRQKCSIVEIFLEYVTLKDVFEPMSKFTQYYANEELVTDSKSNSNDTKKKIFIPCQATDINARHRLLPDKNRKWRFTPGLLIAWHGILIYHGSKAGQKESARCYWRRMHWGTYTPYIQNTMSKHVFEACRRFIHLVDNKIPRPKKGTPLYDPLFKCRKLMEKVMHTMTKKWIADVKVCIDESMIKNLGRAIDFKQYMTMKPITHGIKAFQLTCKSHTLGWEIYLEKGYKLDSTAEAMVLRLIMNANLTQESGRILYTDSRRHYFQSSIGYLWGKLHPHWEENKGEVWYPLPQVISLWCSWTRLVETCNVTN